MENKRVGLIAVVVILESVLGFFQGFLLLFFEAMFAVLEGFFLLVGQRSSGGGGRGGALLDHSARRSDGSVLDDDAGSNQTITGGGVLDRERTPGHDSLDRNRSSGFVHDIGLLCHDIAHWGLTCFRLNNHSFRAGNKLSKSASSGGYGRGGLCSDFSSADTDSQSEQGRADFGDIYLHTQDS